MRVFLLCLLLVVPVFAQSPVEEAKNVISKEKHAVLVQHAHTLLERKEELEKELAEIDKKLAALDGGVDVKMPQSINTGNLVFASNSGCCYVTAVPQ